MSLMEVEIIPTNKQVDSQHSSQKIQERMNNKQEQRKRKIKIKYIASTHSITHTPERFLLFPLSLSICYC